MEEKQDTVITITESQVSLATPISAFSSTKIKRKKSRGHKSILGQNQIRKQLHEPETTEEVVPYEAPAMFRRKKKAAINDFYDNVETKSAAMEKAEEIRAGLEVEFPSFVKALVRSNVTVGFWMHLPMRFCKMHLPKNDTIVFLENENGKEFALNYIAERTALSGGWKAFCSGNSLIEGDVLIFHLIEPIRFKVYVVKGTGSTIGDGDIGDQGVDAHDTPKDSDQTAKEKIDKEALKLDHVPLEASEDYKLEKSLVIVRADDENVVNHFKNESEDCSSESLKMIRSSVITSYFKGGKGFEDFSIVVNGQAIDSLLSDDHRTMYYELCCSQNSYLHANLLQSINHKMATEIIIRTVSIANDIGASKLSSLHDEYAVWDKTLSGFELLGMNVGFIRERLNKLMSIALESEKVIELKCREARNERDRVKEEMKSLELKLSKLKEAKKRLESEIKASKANALKHEMMFQEVVNTPW